MGPGDDDDDDTPTDDPAVQAAIEACDTFVDALCTAASGCNSEFPYEECVSEVEATGLDCTCAVTHDPGILSACLDRLSTIDCATLADVDVPDECDGVVGIRC